MIGSLLALLIVSGQPAPAEDPVVEVQAEVEADAQPQTPPAEVTAEAEVAVAEEPAEEVICRRRLIPSERIGQRNRVVRDCRPASEWGSARRRR
jgi:hypothetical protein